MIDRKNDGQFRNSEFFHPVWTCLKRNDGYGLSTNFSACLPCPDPCITCYMALNISCLTSKAPITPNITNTTNTTTNSTGCPANQPYLNKTSGVCIASCGGSSSLPQNVNGILYCIQTDANNANNYVRVDSALF